MKGKYIKKLNPRFETYKAWVFSFIKFYFLGAISSMHQLLKGLAISSET